MHLQKFMRNLHSLGLLSPLQNSVVCHGSKFATLFSQILGTSPLAYLQQHRLRLAAQYLRNGQGTIQQIAHRGRLQLRNGFQPKL